MVAERRSAEAARRHDDVRISVATGQAYPCLLTLAARGWRAAPPAGWTHRRTRRSACGSSDLPLAVQDPVVVAVRIEWIEPARDLLAVGEPVMVGVEDERVRAEPDLLGAGETVLVVVLVEIIGRDAYVGDLPIDSDRIAHPRGGDDADRVADADDVRGRAQEVGFRHRTGGYEHPARQGGNAAKRRPDQDILVGEPHPRPDASTLPVEEVAAADRHVLEVMAHALEPRLQVDERGGHQHRRARLAMHGHEVHEGRVTRAVSLEGNS